MSRSALDDPPPLPVDSVYTSCYCEENIYLLAQVFQARAEQWEHGWAWDVYVVFISNDGKTVALWNPKASGREVVVWDYHVVLALLPRGAPAAVQRAAWVYDLDSRLPVPCRWLEYVSGTFPYAFSPELAHDMPAAYRSLLRAVPARDFLDHFASDRSHMLVRAQGAHPMSIGAPLSAARQGAVYAQPPPPYPSLCGRKARELRITHNLMVSFVSMEAGAAENRVFGEVMDLSRFLCWISGDQSRVN